MSSIYRFMIKKTYIDLMLSFEYKQNFQIKELSKSSGMDYGYLVYVMGELEKEGYIYKKEVLNHYELTITHRGRELLEVFKSLKKVVEDWPDEKQKTLEE